MKDQLARWARRIDETIADGPKADTAITQFFNEFDKMMHRPAETVEPPDHERVALL